MRRNLKKMWLLKRNNLKKKTFNRQLILTEHICIYIFFKLKKIKKSVDVFSHQSVQATSHKERSGVRSLYC